MPQTDYEIITKIVVSTDQAIKNLQALNAELAKKKKDFKGVASSAKETSAVIQQETKKQTDAEKKLTKEIKECKDKIKEKEKAVDKLGQTAKRVFLVIFAAAILALRQFTRWAIEAAMATIEFQRSTYLFEVSIRALQRVGMETTLAEWRDRLAEIKEQFPIFSEQEIVSALTSITLKLREFEFTAEEMNNVLTISASLARALGKDFGELGQQIASALSRGYFEALQAAGIPISRLEIMQRAYDDALNSTFETMDDAARAHIAYNIVMEHSEAIMEDLGIVGTRTFERLRIAEADLADATKDLGEVWVEVLIQVKTAWADFLTSLIDPIVIQNPFESIINYLADFFSWISSSMSNLADSLEGISFMKGAQEGAKEMSKAFNNMADSAYEYADSMKGIEIFPGTESIAMWAKITSAHRQYFTALEETLLIIQELEKETRDSEGYISYENQQRLAKAYEDAKKLKEEFEGLTGIELPITIDDDMTEREVKEMLNDVRKLITDETSAHKLILHPELQLLVDTGQIDAALAWLENAMGETMGDLTDVTKEAADEMTDEITRAAKEMGEALSDIAIWFEIKAREAGIDLQNDLSRMARDLANDLAKIQRDLAFAIAKANADAGKEIADENKKHRDDELKEEEELLRKLKRLREDFLMDLEDALRERDALKVIQLTREYNVDVRRAKEDYEAGRRDREKAHQDEIADIKAQNARKIAELKAQAAKEANERRIAAALAVEERKIKHEEEMAELDRQLKDKLNALAAEFAEEYELTAEWLTALSKLVMSQYGAGSALANLISQFLLAYELALRVASVSYSYGRKPGSKVGGVQEYAEGGILLATKPTVAVFGEAGPELVHFTPLADISATPNLNRSITEAGIPQDATITHEGGMSIQEQLGLEIWLQDGLEGRIIDQTLGEAARIFNATLGRR